MKKELTGKCLHSARFQFSASWKVHHDFVFNLHVGDIRDHNVDFFNHSYCRVTMAVHDKMHGFGWTVRILHGGKLMMPAPTLRDTENLLALGALSLSSFHFRLPAGEGRERAGKSGPTTALYIEGSVSGTGSKCCQPYMFTRTRIKDGFFSAPDHFLTRLF